MIDSKPFQVPGAITKIQTLARGLRIIIDTQELLTARDMKTLFDLYNKLGWLSFNVHQIEAEQIVDLPPIKTDATKTPSQRLRGVIFRLWEQDNNGHESFENFYNWYMEKLIEKLKERLT